MNEDKDLKRMFDAQRTIDEGLAPLFEDIAAKSLASHNFTPTAFKRRSVPLLAAVASLVIALSVVIGAVSWFNISQLNESDVSSASQNDLRELNQICDALLARIKEMDSETMTQPGAAAQEMDWPKGTDSLIPFETLSFNLRKSP